ncbi:MAG: response regulator [bacterium]|nr:MAG: response regulator [bacterium]
MSERGTILVVDDEESILDMLRQYLSDRGFDVTTAGTGAHALNLLEDSAFDVALIDLKLPDISGLDIISRFNARHPNMKCIIMTAFATLESTIEALRLNVSDYIEKPFDLVRVGEVVEAAYSHIQLSRENEQTLRRLEQANKQLEENKKELNDRILDMNERLTETNESLKKHVTRLKMLYQIGRDISSNENWSDALDRFLMALCKYLDASGTTLLMFSDAGRSLKVRTSFHMKPELIDHAVSILLEAQQLDKLPSEVFHLEGCRDENPRTCLGMREPWEQTVIPLIYKGRWLGFLIIEKQYRSRRDYMHDYHFINTIQTILTEEVANAVNISRLRNLTRFNETVLENINSGVLTTDRNGTIIFLNDKAKEFLGDAAEGIVGFDSLFQNPFGGESLFRHLISGRDRNCFLEGALRLPSGMTVPVRLNARVVEIDEYHGKTIVAVFEDLTEHKAMEEELRRADRLRSLGELAAGVAHEIRNPLTGIATTAQVLREKLSGEDDKVKYLAVIQEEINRLDEIIRNLLIFSRPTPPNPVELSLGTILERTLALIEDEAGDRGVEIVLENQLENDRCYLDGDQIKQIVLNVALNGIQACSKGGRLAVSIRKPDDPAFVRIEMRDTGEGIPVEMAGKIYNPFFTTRSEGTGLGLSISRKMVEGHGGHITHESEPGKGTSFFIDLPRKMMVTTGSEETAGVS